MKRKFVLILGLLFSLCFSFVCFADTAQATSALKLFDVAKAMLVSNSNIKTIEVGDTTPKARLVPRQQEGMYNNRYTDESAIEFLNTYVNATKAHIEFCNPSDYEMRYYSLSTEELDSVKDYLKNATLNREKSSSLADFTYSLHLFDDNDNYIYVLSVDEDKESMFIEAGGLVCEGLADYLVDLSTKATALQGEAIYRNAE